MRVTARRMYLGFIGRVALIVSLSLPVLGCRGGGDGSFIGAPTFLPWMNEEIRKAWADGYLGQGTEITIIDDFRSATLLFGNLGLGAAQRRHGDWVGAQAALTAPSAGISEVDFTDVRPIELVPDRLNILNLSYSIPLTFGSSYTWDAQTQSIVDYAWFGDAVVVKAAGNESMPIGSLLPNGTVDYLSIDLIGAPAVIFVGALEDHGTVDDPASLAAYSNFSGNDPLVQQNFLVVGVTSDLTSLAGTSFAAPIVSGYAAVLGSKFVEATPTQIVNQLLKTARTDTIDGYSVSIHGRGEASIERALAPDSID